MDGIIYILKFEPAFWHAKFYVGWCKPNGLWNRLRQHRTGNGAHITAAAVSQGHRLVLVADFPGTRDDERAIKKRKNTPKFVQSLARRGLLNTQTSVTIQASNVTERARNGGLHYYDDDEREDAMGRIDLTHVNLIALIESDTGKRLKKEGQTHVGACPFCNEGTDRFFVGEGRFKCRRCGKGGDAINYLVYRRGVTFQEACKELGVNLAGERPNTRTINQALKRPDQSTDNIKLSPERESPGRDDPAWRSAAAMFAEECHQRLMKSKPAELDYLYARGIEEATILDHCIGYNHADRTVQWGKTKVFAPQGIVFPWYGAGTEITRVNFRCHHGDEKYRLATGSAMEWYLGWRMVADFHAIIVEGEIDALTIAQAFNWHPLVCPVATGSTNHGRVARLIARLAGAKSVRVAFDADEAGQSAVTFWTKAIKGCIALPVPSPHKDVNALYLATLQDPENDGKLIAGYEAVKSWVKKQ